MSTSRIAILILAASLVEAFALVYDEKGDFDDDSLNSTDDSGGGTTGQTYEPKPHTDYDHTPEWFMTTKAQWGEAKEDNINYKAWMFRQCPDNVDHLSKCLESDIQLSIEAYEQGAYCRSGWLFKGLSKTLQGCARHCYEQFGCERFSLDDNGECRISVGEDSILQKFPRADMQCERALSSSGVDVKLYKINFYHVTHAGVYCQHFYHLIEGINTTAQCAHACKNDDTCRSFSVGSGRADGNCVHGCRIANCHEHTEGSTGTACRSQDAKCGLTDADTSRHQPGSCYHYELDIPRAIPTPDTSR